MDGRDELNKKLRNLHLKRKQIEAWQNLPFRVLPYKSFINFEFIPHKFGERKKRLRTDSERPHIYLGINFSIHVGFSMRLIYVMLGVPEQASA